MACHERDGHLVSVDVLDCSAVPESDRFTFVQSDSTEVDAIIAAAPILKGGIDLLYVDSLYTRKHVKKETYAWFPYMKKNSFILYDDVDPQPYRRGQPKDTVWSELNRTEIRYFVEHLFYANADTTSLQIRYCGTGLACLKKYSPLGTAPNRALDTQKRRPFEPTMHRTKARLRNIRPR